jgi:flagella basal body P-ring formation protein FlgA
MKKTLEHKRIAVMLAVGLLMLEILFVFPASALEPNSLNLNIKNAVLSELKRLFSPDSEITAMRIMNETEILDAKNYKVSSAIINGYTGKNRANFIVTLSDNAKNEKRLLVDISYDATVEAFVTAKPIKKGEYLSESDFYVIRHKISRLPVAAVINRSEIEGKFTKAPIGQGVIVRADFLTSSLSVKKGQRVNVLIAANNLTLSTSGVLRTDAVMGNSVKVMCDISKKEISGILVSADTVKVEI